MHFPTRFAVVSLCTLAVVACGGSDAATDELTGDGNAGGSTTGGAGGGSAGKGGGTGGSTAGKGGASGGTAGASGTAGTAGSAGTAGKGGSGGATGGSGGAGGKAGSGGSTAGSGGTAGTAGASGKGGAGGGTAGSSGTGGSTAGSSGTAGASGKGGAGGGTAGSSGAGGSTAGSGGSTAGSGGSTAGSSGTGGSTAGSGGTGGSTAGSGGTGGAGGACVEYKAEATLKKKPADVIFVIDNSGSMTTEITAVQNNINTSFAQIIGASGIDYRIIMISRHGSATSAQSICVSSPLSGTTCSPIPAQPANTANFFHYSVEIGSTNSLSRILTTFNIADEFNLAPTGWGAWLRTAATKVFIEITDDNQSTTVTPTSFDTQLLALSPTQFGTAAARNYVFHSIAGVALKNPATDPYLPSEPIQNTKCSSAVNTGAAYQNLSILTGGLRFPVCNTASYDAVFQKVAEGVVTGSKVDCDFAVPANPDPNGPPVDAQSALIEYTPGGGGSKVLFKPVPSVADCAPDSFYLDASGVHLCPNVCTAVQADTGAKLDVTWGCRGLGAPRAPDAMAVSSAPDDTAFRLPCRSISCRRPRARRESSSRGGPVAVREPATAERGQR